MKGMFSNAKVGDRIWSLVYGWGTVIRVDVLDIVYPLKVEYDRGGGDWITGCGRHVPQDLNPTWFWDEVVITPPERPLPELAVDTPILVTNGQEEVKAHFYAFDEDGSVFTYAFGLSSFTAQKEPILSKWRHWRLPALN